MAEQRVTQEAVEVLRQGDPDLRATQIAIEVLRENGEESPPETSTQPVVVVVSG